MGYLDVHIFEENNQKTSGHDESTADYPGISGYSVLYLIICIY